MTRVLKGLGIVLVVCALAPASALAGDYYVTQAGAGTTCTNSATPCDFATALGQANLASGANTVHVSGPLSLTSLSTLSVGGTIPGSSVSLVGSGSGPGGTSLSGNVGVLSVGPGSSVSHVALQGPSTPLLMTLGSSVDDVVATTTGTLNAAVLVFGLVSPGDATISHSVISSPMGTPYPALLAAGDATHRTIVSDSRITGGMGVGDLPAMIPSVAAKGTHITRSVIDAGTTGFAVAGSDSSISDSVIHVRAPGGAGVSVMSGLAIGVQPHADVLQDTIIGPGDIVSNGVLVQSAGPGFTAGSATVTGSIVRGFGTGLNIQPPLVVGYASGSGTATLSDFDHVMSGAGNLAVDPGFVDASSEDYRLASGSPLIDAAGTAPAGSETDFAGKDRVTDGNGDGTAARDMGAYESPAVAPPAQPQPAPTAPKKRAASLKLRLPHGTLTLSKGRLVLFSVGCPKGQSFGCRVTVTLKGLVHSSRSKTTRLGTGHAIIAPGEHAKVRIRLTRRAASLIKRGKLRKVTAQVVGQDAAGATAKPRHTYRIRYRAPRRRH